MRILAVQPGADYATADVYRGLVDALRREGHEVFEYLLNQRIAWSGEFLHGAWKRNQKAGGKAPKPTAADVIWHATSDVVLRALEVQPDIVLVISAMYFHPDFFVLLKRAGQRVGIVFTESPYDDAEQLRVAQFVDICWTQERVSVERIERANPHTYYLPAAYDPTRHYERLDDDLETPAHDVVFVGSGFIERIDILHGVDWSGIDLGLYGNWTLMGSRNRLRQYVRSREIPNAATVDLYQKARIGLNLYRSSWHFARETIHVAEAESLNPRALELAACGVFTISDDRREVREVFGDLVPTFRTADELENLVRYFLIHDDEREAIARALPEAVERWNFDERARQVGAQIESVCSSDIRAVA